MEKITFEFDLDRKYLFYSYRAIFFNYKFIGTILILFLISSLISTKKYHSISSIIYDQLIPLLVFVIIMSFVLPYVQILFLKQKISITITKEDIQMENNHWTHIYKYDRFKKAKISNSYYCLYFNTKLSLIPGLFLLPKSNFNKQERDFFENILKENNLI